MKRVCPTSEKPIAATTCIYCAWWIDNGCVVLKSYELLKKIDKKT